MGKFMIGFTLDSSTFIGKVQVYQREWALQRDKSLLTDKGLGSFKRQVTPIDSALFKDNTRPEDARRKPGRRTLK